MELPHPGIYSEIRFTRAALQADKNHLANAPLGPRQRKALEEQIASNEDHLKKLNKKLKERQFAVKALKKP